MFENDYPNHGYKTYEAEEEPLQKAKSKMFVQSRVAAENTDATQEDFNALLNSVILSWNK